MKSRRDLGRRSPRQLQQTWTAEVHRRPVNSRQFAGILQALRTENSHGTWGGKVQVQAA